MKPVSKASSKCFVNLQKLLFQVASLSSKKKKGFCFKKKTTSEKKSLFKEKLLSQMAFKPTSQKFSA
jgi:hypothetical protein